MLCYFIDYVCYDKIPYLLRIIIPKNLAPVNQGSWMKMSKHAQGVNFSPPIFPTPTSTTNFTHSIVWGSLHASPRKRLPKFLSYYDYRRTPFILTFRNLFKAHIGVAIARRLKVVCATFASVIANIPIVIRIILLSN